MTEEPESDKKVVGGPGITSGGNVTIGDVSGQLAIGENITQTQTLSATNLEELRTSLSDFKKGLAELDLQSANQNIAEGNIDLAIDEAKKDKPELSKIKEKFESAINTVKEAGKTINNISELYEPAKKIVKILGIGIALL